MWLIYPTPFNTEKTSCLNEEVNCTEPSTSVSVPWPYPSKAGANQLPFSLKPQKLDQRYIIYSRLRILSYWYINQLMNYGPQISENYKIDNSIRVTQLLHFHN